MPLFRPIPFVHKLLINHLTNASYVIDATIGNGHDAAFIADLLDKNGKLFGFDIQKKAITQTTDKLTNAKCSIELFQKSHHHMFQTLATYEQKIDCIIFNLGFLPHADESLTTVWKSTYLAMIQALALLRYKGLLMIVTYPGHPAGSEENEQIQSLLNQQSPDDYYITMYQQIGENIDSPIVYAIEKRY